MSKGCRRTAAGVGLALTLALSATPAAQAAPGRAHRGAAHAAPTPSLFSVLWSYLVGGGPGVHTAQGPTVDPNGVH